MVDVPMAGLWVLKNWASRPLRFLSLSVFAIRQTPSAGAALFLSGLHQFWWCYNLSSLRHNPHCQISF